MKAKKIAILGATSHIAKGLINNFLREGCHSLALYSRRPDDVRVFLKTLGWAKSEVCIAPSYLKLNGDRYDGIINCVGVGTLNKAGADYTGWFTVTEKFDNLAMDYLRNQNPQALYISLSSGVVYGRESATPAGKDSVNSIRVNELTSKDYYMIARLNAEAKHRAFAHLQIVDVRIFNYFSRYIDLSDGYFITDVLKSILNQKVLLTDEMNIVRDYVHPGDLYSLIKKAMELRKINTAFDMVSAKPADKRKILDFFSREYGLNYKIQNCPNMVSGTGSKKVYYSEYNKAGQIGFQPQFTSMETLREEAKYIVGHHRRTGEG